MADPSTTHYGWVKPTVGADADSWGGVLNADLDGIDATVFAVASIVSVAGGEIIGLSTSASGVSSSLGGVSTSLGGVSASTAAGASSLAAVSASLAGAAASLAGLSASLSGAAAGLAAVSSSLGGVSTSLSATASLATAMSSSLAALPPAGTNANAAGYRGLPQQVKSADYMLQLSDAGTELLFTSSATVTIPSNASAAFQNGSLVKLSAANGVSLSVHIASDTLVLETTGGTGSRVVSGRGHLVISKALSTEWWGVGVNVT